MASPRFAAGDVDLADVPAAEQGGGDDLGGGHGVRGEGAELVPGRDTGGGEGGAAVGEGSSSWAMSVPFRGLSLRWNGCRHPGRDADAADGHEKAGATWSPVSGVGRRWCPRAAGGGVGCEGGLRGYQVGRSTSQRRPQTGQTIQGAPPQPHGLDRWPAW